MEIYSQIPFEVVTKVAVIVGVCWHMRRHHYFGGTWKEKQEV